MASNVSISVVSQREDVNARILLDELCTKTGVIVNIARMVERILKYTLTDVFSWCPTIEDILKKKYRWRENHHVGSTPIDILRNLIMTISDLLTVVQECHKELKSELPDLNPIQGLNDDEDVAFGTSSVDSPSRIEIYLMKKKHVVRDVSKARDWFDNVEHAMSLRHRCEAKRKELQSLTKVIREMFAVRNEVSHYTATEVEKALNTKKLKEYVEKYGVVVESKLCTKFDSHGHIQQADDGESGEKAYLSPSSMLEAARLCIQETDGVPKSKVLSEDERLRLKIERILSTPGKPDKQQLINELAEKEPLTISHIQKLSPHSSQYIVPYNQQRSKRYGLILYTTYNRPGAQEKADNMEQSLETAGFDMIKIEWNDASQLVNMLHLILVQIARDCSLLVLCLMSHGSRGFLHAGDSHGISSSIHTNDVLHHLSLHIAEFIPMVVIIQACQTTSRTTLPSQYFDPATPVQILERRPIQLFRPHTVLLFAAIEGQPARRGAFTAAMAAQFMTADGRKDISSMFDLAAREMVHDDRFEYQQIPEMRMTTSKTLILPPALHNAGNISPEQTQLVIVKKMMEKLSTMNSKIDSLSQQRRSPDDKQEKDLERQVEALQEQLQAKDDEVKQLRGALTEEQQGLQSHRQAESVRYVEPTPNDPSWLCCTLL